SWLDVFFARNGRDRAFDDWRQRTLAAWAGLLDVVVLLDAPDPALAHRIRSRVKPHLVKDRPDAEIYGFTAGFRRAFERVVADLAAAGRLTVDAFPTGDGYPDQHAARLLAGLQRGLHEN